MAIPPFTHFFYLTLKCRGCLHFLFTHSSLFSYSYPFSLCYKSSRVGAPKVIHQKPLPTEGVSRQAVSNLWAANRSLHHLLTRSVGSFIRMAESSSIYIIPSCGPYQKRGLSLNRAIPPTNLKPSRRSFTYAS